MTLQTDAQTTAPSVDELLNAMQGQSITDGWDVICAVDAIKINKLFANQYISQVENNATFFTVVHDTYKVDTQSSVEFINVVLGPPLISFNPGINEVNLQFNFLSGTVNLLDKNGTILLSQSISIGKFQLSGSVPLATLVGEVNNHQVVLDIKNAENFTADLGISEGTQTPLGEYFVKFLQNIINPNDPNSFNFVLGTLVIDSGDNLTPVSFDLSTQTSGTGDDGRLLLLIQTTYSQTGGVPGWNPSNFTNIIPDGYSTTLIISSQAMFQGVVKSTYEALYSQYGLKMQANKNNNGLYTLTSTAGQVDIGPESYSYVGNGKGWWWTGTNTNIPNSLPSEINEQNSDLPSFAKLQDMTLPLSGINVSIQDRQSISLSAALTWNQIWSMYYEAMKGFEQQTDGVNMTAYVNCSLGIALETVTEQDGTVHQIVKFSGTPSVNVPNPDQNNLWAKLTESDIVTLFGDIASTAQTALGKFFSGWYPAIDTFAVSNLLFPCQSALTLEDVYLPGDLVIFGDVNTTGLTISPVSAIVAAGQAYLFSVNNDSQTDVTWSLKAQNSSLHGTIVPIESDPIERFTALYTAPQQVSKTECIRVTATSGSQSAKAILILVPDGVLLSPDVVILSGGATQQFSASIGGDSSLPVSWTINPGSVGSISSDGTYTAPATVNQPTAVTITATITQGTSSISGSALVVVLGQETTGTLLLGPNSVTLTPSQNQKFTITNSSGNPFTKQSNWSILSTLTDPGSIDASGNYTAPSIITNPEVVVVAATFEDSLIDETYVATSLVYLEPSTIN